ncbi:uncharacterized protein LACBIDRAFT_327940 [Laccaria bicolor S238N-H82]|uniref:Predicted protein n=1 Tax=Laccaria bicolor (strain S238N-H82 / ATCC MYA-4686) TaxID=486041 RepID=B0DDA3_LACBS|nr:uncharacterized protein LACBIDRAFT_327940 [Laccaria bicolor S238N-H82]EDR07575.1 predicted protein [Laccaria bicolor S238N-H82]|eukprot:XP_001881967.1 predicted protein [Laccaria bicolor S238N-H82]
MGNSQRIVRESRFRSTCGARARRETDLDLTGDINSWHRNLLPSRVLSCAHAGCGEQVEDRMTDRTIRELLHRSYYRDESQQNSRSFHPYSSSQRTTSSSSHSSTPSLIVPPPLPRSQCIPLPPLSTIEVEINPILVAGIEYNIREPTSFAECPSRRHSSRGMDAWRYEAAVHPPVASLTIFLDFDPHRPIVVFPANRYDSVIAVSHVLDAVNRRVGMIAEELGEAYNAGYTVQRLRRERSSFRTSYCTHSSPNNSGKRVKGSSWSKDCLLPPADAKRMHDPAKTVSYPGPIGFRTAVVFFGVIANAYALGLKHPPFSE